MSIKAHYAAVLLAALLALIAGCPKAEQWKDQQIEAGRKAAQGSKREVPATPLEIPKPVRAALPQPAGATVLSYSVQGTEGKEFTLELLSKDDAAATAQFVLAELSGMGYTPQDNASRIVEEPGLLFSGGRTPLEQVVAYITVNTADQVTLRYQGTWKQPNP